MARHVLLDGAAELVRRVLRFEHPAEQAVAQFFREHPAFGSRDRRALGDTVFALLRGLARWRHLAGRGEGLERRLVLLAWQGDLGVLRSALAPDEPAWLATARATPDAALPEAARHNLPAWLADALRRRLGPELEAWIESIDRPARLDLRVNAMRARREAVAAQLAADGIVAVPTPYATTGLRIDGKPDLRQHALHREGAIEPQDEGSQLLALALGARRGELVVDYCAGAGGKTLAVGAQMRGTGRLMAFDVAGARLAALAPRLAASGLANVHTAQIEGEDDERVLRLVGKADRVLVDAPCTGLGTLRRHPDLKWRQSEASVAAFAREQRKILAAASRLVKPGGTLLYATCSVLDAEGREVAAAFEEGCSTFARLSILPALQRARVPSAAALVDGPDLSLWTHRHGTDGFYAAAWARRA